jgi:hypothetical protein
MTTDMFSLSLTLTGPFLIHDLSPGIVHTLTGRVSRVEQELLTIPGHLRF